jgi:hypothetical protein
MNTRRLRTTLFALCFFATDIHAATVGTIRFTGLVFEPASAAVLCDARRKTKLEQTRQTYPLSQAKMVLSSDVLDYFASYASKDAALVSVTYL